jgi:hypothetical protein
VAARGFASRLPHRPRTSTPFADVDKMKRRRDIVEKLDAESHETLEVL